MAGLSFNTETSHRIRFSIIVFPASSCICLPSFHTISPALSLVLAQSAAAENSRIEDARRQAPSRFPARTTTVPHRAASFGHRRKLPSLYLPLEASSVCASTLRKPTVLSMRLYAGLSHLNPYINISRNPENAFHQVIEILPLGLSLTANQDNARHRSLIPAPAGCRRNNQRDIASQTSPSYVLPLSQAR